MYKIIGNISLVYLCFLLVSCGASYELKNNPPKNNKVACFGDSLVAGVGASQASESYPAQLSRMIGLPIDNFGKSGDRASTALRRIDKLMTGDYGIIIVTLGGNEFIGRENWGVTDTSIRTVFQKLQSTGALIVYTSTIRHDLYEDICREEGVLFIGDIMDGLLHNDPVMADTIHPNDKGYKIFAERVATVLKERNIIQ